jgi:hypothetical protein
MRAVGASSRHPQPVDLQHTSGLQLQLAGRWYQNLHLRHLTITSDKGPCCFVDVLERLPTLCCGCDSNLCRHSLHSQTSQCMLWHNQSVRATCAAVARKAVQLTLSAG